MTGGVRYKRIMDIEQRRKSIVSTLVEEGRVRIKDLSRTLNVSDDTVRRDLDVLSERGFLHKTHGGAINLEVPSIRRDVRRHIATDAKARIGEQAIRHLPLGGTVFIDAGQTALEVARRLPSGPFTIITVSMDVASILSERTDIRLILIGGEWDNSQRLFRGPATIDAIKSYRASLAVMGACAVDRTFGVTASEEWDCAAKLAIMKISERKMLVADHTKFGRQEPFFVAALGEFDLVVSDRPQPSPDELQDLEPSGSRRDNGWRMAGD